MAKAKRTKKRKQSDELIGKLNVKASKARQMAFGKELLPILKKGLKDKKARRLKATKPVNKGK